MGESFTSTFEVGAIDSNSRILSTDATSLIVKEMLVGRYESVSLGTWTTSSQVDTFFSTYTHENNYESKSLGTRLKLGNYITIMDGTYNTEWEIAGFDVEYSRTAADGTTYDNGYGIMFIPKISLGESRWCDLGSRPAYYSSYVRKTKLPSIATSLSSILGSHMVNRNVLLSSSYGSSGYATAYTWTTDYLTLMSVGQCTGTFASHYNKYDDGEANYRLPLFKYETYYQHYSESSPIAWSRGLYSTDGVYSATYGVITNIIIGIQHHIRPCLYLR